MDEAESYLYSEAFRYYDQEDDVTDQEIDYPSTEDDNPSSTPNIHYYYPYLADRPYHSPYPLETGPFDDPAMEHFVDPEMERFVDPERERFETSWPTLRERDLPGTPAKTRRMHSLSTPGVLVDQVPECLKTNRECCICIEPLTSSQKRAACSSCGITFHTACLASYAQNIRVTNPIRCPWCRGKTSFALIPTYKKGER
jgi:hypothetical protein